MFGIRDLEYVIAVYETKSMVAAAKNCRVSQPALTMQINKLEEILGFKIFKRARNNTTLTFKGQKFIEHAKLIIQEYQKIKQINNSDNEIRIGIIPTISPYLLPRIAGDISEIKEKIFFFDLNTTLLLEKISQGKIEIGILAHYPKLLSPDLKYQKLYQEEFFFVTDHCTKLSSKEGIKSSEIILLEEGNCVNQSIREICETRLNHHSFAATSFEVVKAMVANGNGYGILPVSCLGKNNNFRIQKFDSPKFREIGICYRKDFNNPNDILNKLFKILSQINPNPHNY